jgi:phosphoglycerol transferase MdoB-like AlkP superfamily enzyme
MAKLIHNRFGGVVIFLALYVTASFLTRSILAVQYFSDMSWSWSMMASFLLGLAGDLLTGALALIPLTLYLAFLPQFIFRTRIHAWIMHLLLLAFSYGVVFVAAAELVFWNEFKVRFNFIAVDYLVYTKEVIGNIRESYPVGALLVVLVVPALLLFGAVLWTRWMSVWQSSATGPRHRLAVAGALILVPAAVVSVFSESSIPDFANNFNRELAKNGVFSLFAAFQANELSYDSFYLTMDDHAVFKDLRQLLQADDARFISDEPTDLRRRISHAGDEKRYNVIQITVESLSASFMGSFGNTKGLTPELDRLASEGTLFTNFYATGTRTTRGMEALSLALPPTPGRSIIHRKNNHGLFTLGSVLRDRGYDTVFLYGGYGYFDNMNEFFSSNGYRVVDRAEVPTSEVSFATIWGACDEDLFRWTMAEADRSFAKRQPFHHFVMTTSNHRPFTYPEGRIDIASGTGREGAVRYTDFAIGQFIEQARNKPWFDNTIFVIVADHCASSAGRTELEVAKYRIPLIIYGPGLIEPHRVDTLCSQVDYPPTLLALLNMSYDTLFFGRDVIASEPDDARALIGNYQTLGLLERDTLQVLRPGREQACYHYDEDSHSLSPAADSASLREQAIDFYQGAGRLFSSGRYSMGSYSH